jgi:hypothetical protein
MSKFYLRMPNLGLSGRYMLQYLVMHELFTSWRHRDDRRKDSNAVHTLGNSNPNSKTIKRGMLNLNIKPQNNHFYLALSAAVRVILSVTAKHRHTL